MNEGRYDERLKTRVEESTWLKYNGLNDNKLEIPRDKGEVNKWETRSRHDGSPTDTQADT
jgi:hypothetical protein